MAAETRRKNVAKKKPIKIDKKPIGLAALLLAAFAIVGVGLVAVTKEVTAERIEKQRTIALLNGLNKVLPKSRYDNDLANDFIIAQDPVLLGGHTPRIIYRARKSGLPVAAVISTAAPDGYNTSVPIQILVGINLDGSLANVRVVNHGETPGLGDGIKLDSSDWILSFNDKSLDNYREKQWKVKKDGGEFDQFTGATITPRAVVRAVHKTLKYFKKHQGAIFSSSETEDIKQEHISVNEVSKTLGTSHDQ